LHAKTLPFSELPPTNLCDSQSVVLDISLSIFRFFSSPEKSAEGGMKARIEKPLTSVMSGVLMTFTQGQIR
jgi:hypothetical protein